VTGERGDDGAAEPAICETPGVSGPEPGAERPNDFDAIADDLYALHPDAFAAARDEQVRQARAGGRAALARDLARLRRPTMSAWLVNLLWRDQREVVEQLLDLPRAMARAQARASGDALRTLTAQRRDLEAALIRRAHALADDAGVKVTPAMAREAQDTLAAAMNRPDVAAEVRAGRVVKPAAYAGFGELLVALPDPPGADEEPPDEETAAAAAPVAVRPADDRVARLAREAAAEAERREEAERRAQAERRRQEARAAVEAAAGALAAEARAAESAERHHRELRDQVEQLRQALRALELSAAAAASAAGAAAHRRAEAEQAHEAALQARQRAELDAEP
jgi:hypothetical protein